MATAACSMVADVAKRVAMSSSWLLLFAARTCCVRLCKGSMLLVKFVVGVVAPHHLAKLEKASTTFSKCIASLARTLEAEQIWDKVRALSVRGAEEFSGRRGAIMLGLLIWYTAFSITGPELFCSQLHAFQKPSVLIAGALLLPAIATLLPFLPVLFAIMQILARVASAIGIPIDGGLSPVVTMTMTVVVSALCFLARRKLTATGRTVLVKKVKHVLKTTVTLAAKLAKMVKKRLSRKMRSNLPHTTMHAEEAVVADLPLELRTGAMPGLANTLGLMMQRLHYDDARMLPANEYYDPTVCLMRFVTRCGVEAFHKELSVLSKALVALPGRLVRELQVYQDDAEDMYMQNVLALLNEFLEAVDPDAPPRLFIAPSHRLDPNVVQCEANYYFDPETGDKIDLDWNVDWITVVKWTIVMIHFALQVVVCLIDSKFTENINPQ